MHKEMKPSLHAYRKFSYRTDHCKESLFKVKSKEAKSESFTL